MSTNQLPAVQLAELVYHKRNLQAELKAVEEKIGELETGLLAQWQVEGVTQMKVITEYGPYVLYCSTRTFAKAEFVDRDKLEDEFPALMTLNYSKAGSLLAELMATGNEEALAHLAAAGVYPNEQTRINVKKG